MALAPSDATRNNSESNRIEFAFSRIAQLYTFDLFLLVWARSEEVSEAVTAAAARARASIDEQERRLLDDLATAKNDRIRQLDNHMAACDLQVRPIFYAKLNKCFSKKNIPPYGPCCPHNSATSGAIPAKWEKTWPTSKFRDDP